MLARQRILCKQCSSKDTTKCTECLKEYYTTLCKSCFKNCLKCENEEKCEECKEGFELNSDLTSCSQISNLETECLDKIEGCVMC